MEDRAAALAPFRIARVVEAVPHPNADRLRVCRVDAGDGRITEVVCGAPNARTGMKGVFAAAGSFIPGTGITLKVGEIRGVSKMVTDRNTANWRLAEAAAAAQEVLVNWLRLTL